ncbi:MAG: T9SS type A sorting domain-containing protein, partial [Bacteroidia bacterium]
TFVDKTLYGKTYAWTFTSDTVLRAYEANPTIKTSGPQKMQVKLTVTSNAGCVKSRTDSIQIFALGLNDNIANQINLQAYPIPFNDILQLNMEGKQNESAIIELFNITGQKTLDKKIDLTVGVNQINLNTNAQKSGIYIVKVTTKAGIAWLKTIKE